MSGRLFFITPTVLLPNCFNKKNKPILWAERAQGVGEELPERSEALISKYLSVARWIGDEIVDRASARSLI